MTRALFLLLAATLLSGCDGDDPPVTKTELSAAPPLPECPNDSYKRCDIRERRCQKHLAKLAACLRDDPPLDNLQIDLLSEDAFANMVSREATAPSPAAVAFRKALAAFELAEPDSPAAMGGDSVNPDLLGLYRPSEKRIILIDHGKPVDSVQNNLTLLHELVHALQDADYDLVNWPAGEPWYSFDVSLARKSVVEGEARFYEYRAAVPFLGLDIAKADFDSTLHEHLDYVTGKAFNSKSPINDSYATFPYAYGALRAYAAWQDGGPRGIDPLWAMPPETTQFVMSTALGLGEPQAAGIEIAPPDLSGAPFDAPLMPVASDSLGAWGLALLLNHLKEPSPDKLALSWRGDRVFVAQPPGAAYTYALWELELESPERARDVDRVLARLYTADHGVSGTRVYLSGAYPSYGPRPLTDAGLRWLRGN